MEVTETLLPGVGIRYELETLSGLRLAIVVQRGGATEVSVYERADPDEARGVFRLTRTEAETIADILGAPRLVQRFADLSREVPGLQSARIPVAAGSRFAGRPLGDTRARTTTGCSIVALVRGAEVVTSPGPAQVLQAGDVLVAIGAQPGLEQLSELLATGR